MAWNEPNGNKDPWGRKKQTSSELDDIVKNFSKFLNGMFETGGGSGEGPTKKNVGILASVILVIYFKRNIRFCRTNNFI